VNSYQCEIGSFSISALKANPTVAGITASCCDDPAMQSATNVFLIPARPLGPREPHGSSSTLSIHRRLCECAQHSATADPSLRTAATGRTGSTLPLNASAFNPLPDGPHSARQLLGCAATGQVYWCSDLWPRHHAGPPHSVTRSRPIFPAFDSNRPGFTNERQQRPQLVADSVSRG